MPSGVLLDARPGCASMARMTEAADAGLQRSGLRGSGLTGLRVLELGEAVPAAYAAKLLADLGADVIKIEPPDGDGARHRGPFPPGFDGDPERSGLFLGLNTNKRSRVLDLMTADGTSHLRELIAETDIVIHNLSAAEAEAIGLDGPRLLADRPDVVVCAVTPFGHTGPQADWRGEELSVVHGGGWGWLIPGDSTDPEAPPLKVFGHFAHLQAGMAAAMAAVAAFDKAERTGVGEAIDLSVMAYVSSILESAFVAWSYRGEIPGRTGGRLLNPWKILRCSDGLIFVVTVEQDQWERLVEMMGNPDWAQLEIFADMEGRAANQDVLYVYLQEWVEQFRVDELFHAGQERRICFAPLFTMADLAEQQHLRERNFFHTVEHHAAGAVEHLGSPYQLDNDWWSLRRPAPKLNEHADADWTDHRPPRPPPAIDAVAIRPLDGIRVVDFSWVWAGPFCTLQLAHLGADILKVESAVRPALGRRLPISPLDCEVTLNTSGYFNQWDQGKRSVDLDLSDPEARAEALKLVATADVVVDNYATGVMERLGLSDDELRKANPNVVIASVTGYGHTGPLRSYMGYGPTTAPLSGLAALTGHVGGEPVEAGLSIGDPAAGLTAAFAIVAALTARRRTGQTARIDVSLWEATAVNAVDGWMNHALGGPPLAPAGSRDLREAPHGVYRCAGDDEWVTLACMSDAEWTALAGLIDPALAEDSRFATSADRKENEDALDAIVSAWSIGQDKWEVTARVQAVGVAAYPSLDCSEVEANEQLRAQDFFVRLEHPEVGHRTHCGVPWRMLNSADTVVGRAPLLGEHTAEILAEATRLAPS